MHWCFAQALGVFVNRPIKQIGPRRAAPRLAQRAAAPAVGWAARAAQRVNLQVGGSFNQNKMDEKSGNSGRIFWLCRLVVYTLDEGAMKEQSCSGKITHNTPSFSSKGGRLTSQVAHNGGVTVSPFFAQTFPNLFLSRGASSTSLGGGADCDEAAVVGSPKQKTSYGNKSIARSCLGSRLTGTRYEGGFKSAMSSAPAE